MFLGGIRQTLSGISEASPIMVTVPNLAAENDTGVLSAGFADTYHGRASLDLSVLGDGSITCTVEARGDGGVDGNDITVALVGDSDLGAGVVVEEVGSVVTIHYEVDVSTGEDVEAAIDAQSTLIRVQPGTAGTYGQPAVKASKSIGGFSKKYDLLLVAKVAGVAGNGITVAITGGGSLSYSELGQALTVTYEDGVSIDLDVGDLFTLNSTLVDSFVNNLYEEPLVAPGSNLAVTNLENGSDAVPAPPIGAGAAFTAENLTDGRDPYLCTEALTSPAYPRNLSVHCNAESWDGGDIVITGTFRGQPQTETITPLGTSTVYGHKPFTTVTEVRKTAVASGATTVVYVGWGRWIGMPVPFRGTDPDNNGFVYGLIFNSQSCVGQLFRPQYGTALIPDNVFITGNATFTFLVPR